MECLSRDAHSQSGTIERQRGTQLIKSRSRFEFLPLTEGNLTCIHRWRWQDNILICWALYCSCAMRVCEWEFDSLAHERQRDNLLRKDFSERHTRYYFKVGARVSFHSLLCRRCVKNLLKSLSTTRPSRMKDAGALDEPASHPRLCVAHANWLLINLSLMGVIIKTRPTCSRRIKIARALVVAVLAAFKRWARACWQRVTALKSVSLEPLLHSKRARWQQQWAPKMWRLFKKHLTTCAHVTWLHICTRWWADSWASLCCAYVRAEKLLPHDRRQVKSANCSAPGHHQSNFAQLEALGWKLLTIF